MKTTCYCCSFTSLCPTLCHLMDCSIPGSPDLHYLWSWLKFMSIESVMPSNHLILSLPFFCFQSFPASGSFPVSWLFMSGGQSIYWSFSLSISPSNEYSGLISFRIEWFDLLAVQGTLKSLLQHHNSKARLCFNIKKLRV